MILSSHLIHHVVRSLIQWFDHWPTDPIIMTIWSPVQFLKLYFQYGLWAHFRENTSNKTIDLMVRKPKWVVFFQYTLLPYPFLNLSFLCLGMLVGVIEIWIEFRFWIINYFCWLWCWMVMTNDALKIGHYRYLCCLLQLGMKLKLSVKWKLWRREWTMMKTWFWG